MDVRLDYGTTGLCVRVPGGATVIEPREAAALADPVAALTRVLRAPNGRPPLSRLARRGQRVAISICDGTRPQPRRETLTALLGELTHLDDADVTLLVATGTHRGNTETELEQMLGREILGRFRVINHDARDASTLAHACTTSTGVRAFLNREWLAADVRITTGTVEPHFFAGFSGGPKMVAPGLAGLDTVLTLHDASRIGSPRASWGITDGNPIHDDVREIARLVGVDFAIDVILNRDKQIAGVFAGDLFAEHAEACSAARRDAMQAVPAPFDVVLTSNSGFPLDQNLYQAVKGFSAAARIVKRGGTIVCAAECRDGIPAHGAYAEVLASAATPAALLDRITTPGYRVPDQWQVQIQAQLLLHARIALKADGLSAEQIRAAHLDPVTDLEAAVHGALRAAGPGATLCVLPRGPRTVPYLTA